MSKLCLIVIHFSGCCNHHRISNWGGGCLYFSVVKGDCLEEIRRLGRSSLYAVYRFLGLQEVFKKQPSSYRRLSGNSISTSAIVVLYIGQIRRHVTTDQWTADACNWFMSLSSFLRIHFCCFLDKRELIRGKEEFFGMMAQNNSARRQNGTA